jgi:alpha-L-arabinofuranosidase
MKNCLLRGIAAALLLATLSPRFTMAAEQAATTITIQANRPGSTINKNVYGQFSEHLGSGI